MSDLDNKAEAAAAFLNAGNLVRAKALCREVLEKQDDNWTAFQTLFRLRKRESDYDQAEAACYWRLERLPGCVHTKILLLIKYGKRLKTLSPDMRVEAKEIIIFSYLAMLPIFWLPHFIYVVYSCFLKRLPLVIQIAGIVVLYYYTATLLNRVSFHYLSENHISLYRLIIKSFPFVAIGWVFYLQLGFLRLFPHLSNRNKAVNIREDY